MAKQQPKKMWYAHLTRTGIAKLERIPVRGKSRFVIDRDVADQFQATAHANRSYAKNGDLGVGTVFEEPDEALDKLDDAVDKAITRAEQVLTRLKESKASIEIGRQKLKDRESKT